MGFLVAAILLPLVGGAIMPLMKFKERSRVRSFYVEVVTLVTSVLVFCTLLHKPSGTLQVLDMAQQLMIAFKVDGMGMVFAGLVAFLWPLATLYAFEYMHHEERETSFFTFYTMSFGITLAIAFSANLFTLYVFYEFLTFFTLPLVIHKKDARSIHAGRKYLYYAVSGAALAFIGLIFIITYGSTNAFELGGVLSPDNMAKNQTFLQIAYVLCFVGFGVKAAIFPLYAWLPAASIAPTPVTALLHAVAVVNAGAFAVIRMTYYSFGTALSFGTWAQITVVCICAITILFGSSMALKEQHLKRRLAYSTMSNLSYILLGAAIMTPDGLAAGLSHMLFHGLIKILLFYCAGAILIKTGHQYIQNLRGMGKIMPFTMAIFTLAAIALVGTPPLPGFVSKMSLITAALNAGTMVGIVSTVALLISTVLTALYMMNVVIQAYFLPVNAHDVQLLNEKNDPSWQMKIPLAVISLMMIIAGICATPIMNFLSRIALGGV